MVELVLEMQRETWIGGQKSKCRRDQGESIVGVVSEMQRR